jgi:hypothetical protein
MAPSQVPPLDPRTFLDEQRAVIRAFCADLDRELPSYSYVPLATDDQRVVVMKSRLYNEFRAGEIFGTWLSTTPELEFKYYLAEASNEELGHARLLIQQLQERGADPFAYGPPPEQLALFHTMERLESTVERLAAFQLAGEAVAAHLIRRCLESATVPEWVKEPYHRIIEDESEHGSAPTRFLEKYAVSLETQRLVRRGVSLGLTLRRRYFDALDAMVFSGIRW